MCFSLTERDSPAQLNLTRRLALSQGNTYCAFVAQLISTIADRVRTLRAEHGLSAQRLADRMSELGISWKREVVANLENGRRGTVGVDELLALAIVFDVPPVTLLVNPTAAESELAEGVSTSPTMALLWMIGDIPWSPASIGRWSSASAPIRLVRRFHEESGTAANELAKLSHMRAIKMESESVKATDESVHNLLERLWRTVVEMQGAGMDPPDLPGELIEEGRLRGIWDMGLPPVLTADARRGGAWKAENRG